MDRSPRRARVWLQICGKAAPRPGPAALWCRAQRHRRRGVCCPGPIRQTSATQSVHGRHTTRPRPTSGTSHTNSRCDNAHTQRWRPTMRLAKAGTAGGAVDSRCRFSSSILDRRRSSDSVSRTEVAAEADSAARTSYLPLVAFLVCHGQRLALSVPAAAQRGRAAKEALHLVSALSVPRTRTRERLMRRTD